MLKKIVTSFENHLECDICARSVVFENSPGWICVKGLHVCPFCAGLQLGNQDGKVADLETKLEMARNTLSAVAGSIYCEGWISKLCNETLNRIGPKS